MIVVYEKYAWRSCCMKNILESSSFSTCSCMELIHVYDHGIYEWKQLPIFCMSTSFCFAINSMTKSSKVTKLKNWNLYKDYKANYWCNCQKCFCMSSLIAVELSLYFLLLRQWKTLCTTIMLSCMSLSLTKALYSQDINLLRTFFNLFVSTFDTIL